LANIKSQKKRNRQNEKRREKNASIKTALRTSSKKIIKTLDSKEIATQELTSELLKQFYVKIDKAARTGLVHKKTASRKKSRLAKRINSYNKQNS
jgi:small subunit ribosomal protein S20